MSKLIKGDKLSIIQVKHVKAAYIYRWTHENAMRCRAYSCKLCNIEKPYVNDKSANGHTHPTIPLQTDEQWLAEHAFYVNKDGSFDRRRTHAQPSCLVD